MKAVIDTNVVLAGLANTKGAAFKIFRRYFRQQFNWVNSQQTFDEYQGVLLLSDKIPISRTRIFLHLIKQRSLFVNITYTLQVCQDPDDDIFLETAVLSDADFLVTKNIKHFPYKSYQGIRIVKVSKFLKELEKRYP